MDEYDTAGNRIVRLYTDVPEGMMYQYLYQYKMHINTST